MNRSSSPCFMSSRVCLFQQFLSVVSYGLLFCFVSLLLSVSILKYMPCLHVSVIQLYCFIYCYEHVSFALLHRFIRCLMSVPASYVVCIFISVIHCSVSHVTAFVFH